MKVLIKWGRSQRRCLAVRVYVWILTVSNELLNLSYCVGSCLLRISPQHMRLRFLQFFTNTSVSWGILPSTNLVDCADNCYVTHFSFFYLFFTLFSFYFALLASVFFKHLLLVRILWYISYLFPPLFYCFLYSLSVKSCASILTLFVLAHLNSVNFFLLSFSSFLFLSSVLHFPCILLSIFLLCLSLHILYFLFLLLSLSLPVFYFLSLLSFIFLLSSTFFLLL